MANDYHFMQWRLRAEMVEALERYVKDHLPLGDFLTAALANDLQGALSRADDDNLANFPALGAYIYNEIPSACHGSMSRVDAWLRKREEKQNDPA